METTFKINLSKYPRVFNVDTPFWEDLYSIILERDKE